MSCGDILRPKFRMPGHAGRWRGAGSAARRQGAGRSGRARRRRPGGAQHLHRHLRRRRRRAADHPPRASRESRGPHPGDRLLRPARARRNWPPCPASNGWSATRTRRRSPTWSTLAASADPPLPYHGNIHVGDIFAQHDFLSAPVEDAAGDRTRPNLKIQDGCNNRCSFCIIPFVRGRSRSAPAEQVVEQVRGLAAPLSRSGAQRHQPGPLGQGTGQRRPGAPAPGGSDAPPAGRNRSRAAAAELGRADGFLRRPAGPDGRIAAHRPARARARCRPARDRILRRMHRKYRPRHYADRILKARAPHARRRHRRRRHGGLPRRNGRRFRREPRFHRRPALHLPARLHLLGAARHARRRSIPMPCPCPCARSATACCASWPRPRTWNSASSMVGRTLSAVTLHEPGAALSANYLKIRIAVARPPNLLADIEIGGTSSDGLYESGITPLE